LTAGALLIELMFWIFDKVPFTCSYSRQNQLVDPGGGIPPRRRYASTLMSP
jgi:hypothetical protein